MRFLSLLALVAPLVSASSLPPFVVSPSGVVIGRTNQFNPTVTEFLGIPFALPPTGSRRFAAPEPAPYSLKPINATSFGLSCPAIPQPPASQLGITLSAPSGEDCLSVNVWTRDEWADKKTRKPVLVWIYGGAFVFGTSNSPLYNGADFVANNDVIVVSLNYRTNVFGFPNAPGLAQQNLGILDQRLALEWVRRNIASFGGDPRKLTLFGHSAGGASVDAHAYAFAKDPIVRAYIPQSGAAGLVGQIGGGNNYYAWGNLTATLGCDEGDEKAQLECMRHVPFDAIVNGTAVVADITRCSDAGAFGPRVDNEIILSTEEYVRRGKLGQFAKSPLLIGNTDQEITSDPGDPLGGTVECSSVPRPPNLTPEQDAALATAIAFTCPARIAANIRLENKVPVWRYRYFGSFDYNVPGTANVSAYHGAELPVLFGLANRLGNLKQREKDVIRYMQAAWTAFATDPDNGLNKKPFKWPEYTPTGKTGLVRLTFGQEVQASFSNPAQYDAVCDVYANVSGAAPVPKSLESVVEMVKRGVDPNAAAMKLAEREVAEIAGWYARTAVRSL